MLKAPRRRIPVFLTLLFLGGCAEITPIGTDAGPSGITQTGYPGLDAGAKTQASLHFEVRAYQDDQARAVSELVERLYTHVMNDTGLYSFMPPGLYPIVIYGSQEEFLRKTGAPSWSGGVAVGNAIYTFESRRMAGVLAHEMTHLVFNEYMARPRDDLRWLNEGLAVYEEQEAAAAGGRGTDWALSSPGGFHPVPFEQMLSLAPMSEEARAVNSWYIQVGSVVRFMIERGGGVGFSQLLKGLHDGRPLEESIHAGFPGLWMGLAALENAWKSR